jgi:hypothetical protein
MSTTITTCYTCHLPVAQASAQPIHLLIPAGRRRAGQELLKASATLYECGSCQDAYFASLERAASNEQLYIVSSCGTTRTVSAATPEAAAVLFMQERGWRSTRSIAVCRENKWTEYLDCQLVNGQLEYSEQVDLP